MDWEENSDGHANDFDNHRSNDFESQRPFSGMSSSESFADPAWKPLDMRPLNALNPAEKGA